MASKRKVVRSKSTKKRASPRSQDAVALLKSDHATVEELFDRFEKTKSDEKKQKLAQLICAELKIHTAIEEEIFYPAVLGAIRDEDMIDEAEVEHASAKDLISQIEAGSPSQEKWDAKVTVLGEYIKHHVKEEHTEMFPKARKSKLDLKALGERMLARKEELAEQM